MNLRTWRSPNPLLAPALLRPAAPTAGQRLGLAAPPSMTLEGVVQRCLLLSAAGGVCAWAAWWRTAASGVLNVALMLVAAIVVSFLAGAVTRVAPRMAPVATPVYAVAAGTATGGVSAGIDWLFPGVVSHAVGLTLATLLVMLLAYRLRLVRATEGLKLGLGSATAALALVYAFDFVLRLAGVEPVVLLHESGLWGVLFNAAVLVLASFRLVLDFGAVEEAVAAGLPRHMEWYCAYAITYTALWIYVEWLRLLVRQRPSPSGASTGSGW